MEWDYPFGGVSAYNLYMAKITVTHTSGWELKDGDRVDYYDAGNWSMELIQSQGVDSAIFDAKQAIKAHRAWLRWLKKQKRLS